jgi:hypothetical protein
MGESLWETLLLVNRFVHIICTTVLVGGTLFYEMIVPIAIDELKQEQQLLVFGRARWTFKGVVWTCAILLVLSGAVSTARMWHTYTGGEGHPSRVPIQVPGKAEPMYTELRRPGWWWAAHASLGLVAIGIAVALTTVRRPPDYPITWMRVNLLVLMVVIFFASTARHMGLVIDDAERTRPIPTVKGELAGE